MEILWSRAPNIVPVWQCPSFIKSGIGVEQQQHNNILEYPENGFS